MSCHFGIHVGNSNICLTLYRDGNIEVISNKNGERVTPAILAAILEQNEYVIGERMVARNGPLTIINNLQFCNFDMTDEEFEYAKSTACCKIEQKPLNFILSKDDFTTKSLSPYEVNVELFKNILSSATQIFHVDEDPSCYTAVISVPMNFSPSSCLEIAKSAEDAGLIVSQVISNTAAAALAYNIGQDSNVETSTVLVFRVGGLTSEVAIIDVEKNGIYTIEKQLTKNNLGGNVFTKALADYIADEFYKKYKLNPRESRRTMAKLMTQAENSKHILSTLSSTQVFIESLIDGIDFNINISRARFESIVAGQILLFKQVIEEITKNVETQIDKIVLCGGSMKIPKLQQTILDMFPDADKLNTITPDETIAIGCARQASYSQKVNGSKLTQIDIELEMIVTNIYCKRKNSNVSTLLFPKGSLVTSKKQFTEFIPADEKLIIFDVYEEDKHNNIINLGEVKFDNPENEIFGDNEFIATLSADNVTITLIE